jgi:chromate reductase
MRILGIAGSLRRGSHNRRLLRAASALLPPGTELVEWDGLATLPAFDEDLETTPPAPVRAFFEAIEGADALLIATPEYNASLPGALKNAIDWASRPFPENVLRYKPTAVVGASTGLFGAVWAQADLRRILERTGTRVVGDELPVGQADTAFSLRGDLLDRLDQLQLDTDFDLVADQPAAGLERHVPVQTPLLAADLGLRAETGAGGAPGRLGLAGILHR